MYALLVDNELTDLQRCRMLFSQKQKDRGSCRHKIADSYFVSHLDLMNSELAVASTLAQRDPT